tara:strand:+ start:553 stop:909 length:357 start_codon:yes stop_codon:yes gene_type:complete
MSSKNKQIDQDPFTVLIDKNLDESIKTDIKKVSKVEVDNEIYGKLAVITGIISYIPLAYEIWKTKDTRNFTNSSLLIAIFSNIMWIVYGLKGNSSTNLWNGILYLSIFCYITIFKILY